MTYTYEEMFRRLEEVVADNKKQLRRDTQQRRTEFTDLFGIPHTAQGDSGTPATFYISISPDMIYELQYCFKLVIQPFAMTLGGGGTESAVVEVNNQSLSVNNNAITPNPHKHTTEAHTHNVVSGITLVHTTADDFTMSIEGIDITDYLREQHDDDWIEGEGIYPTNRLEDLDDFYDILDVACLKYAEGGDDWWKLVRPGFKPVQIHSNAPFQATLYQYTKFSNMGR